MDSINNSYTEYNISCKNLKTIGIQLTDVHIEEMIRYMTIVLVTLLFPISFCMNLAVISLMAKFKHLRQTTFLLALQLILVDLVYTCMISPATIVSAIARQWILGIGLCQFIGNLSVFLRVKRSLLMFVFVCDRFCTVFCPFGYPRIRTRVLTALIIASLLLSTAFFVTPFVFDCVVFSRSAWQCINTYVGCLNEDTCFTFRIASSVITNIMGGIIPMIMYITLFIKARRIQQNTAVPVAVMSGDLLKKRKRERKANYTFLNLFLFTFAFIFLASLYFIIIRPMLRYVGTDSPVTANVFVFLVGIFFNLLPILDSIAIMRNSEFRSALKKIKKMIKNYLFS